MKSTIIAFAILLILIFGSYTISKEQEKVLVPIYYIIKEMPNDNSKDLKDLKDCMKKYKEKRFIIELGIPNKDYDNLHSLFKKASIALKNDDDKQFSVYIEECKIYLSSMLEYSDITLSNIL
jgi:hypothetical protein